MTGTRLAMFKDKRASNDSRKRRGYRATAMVLSAVVALSLLPVLTVPMVSSSALLAAKDANHDTASPVMGEAEATGSGGSGSDRAIPLSVLAVDDQKKSREEAEGGGVDGGRGLLVGAGAGEGGAISHEEEGGKLKDGRDRCFVDGDGYHRCYPTVFFFGTSKCGTTSLARWLDEHPSTHWVANPRRPHQIEQTGVKEAHVFDDPPKGDRYTEQGMLHEKMAITTPKVHADSVVIDYTPHYLAVAETPHRIADMYGGKGSGLKFIVTLREPASRAISSWEFKNEFNPKKGRQEESRTLSKTIRDGEARANKLNTCLNLATATGMATRERDLKHCNPRKFLEMPLFVSHVGKSMFALQLERWFNLFGRENFKVVFTDDMASDPVGVLEDVLGFLGMELTSEDASKGLPDLARWRKITGMAYNKTKSKKKDELGSQVTDEVKEELKAFFEPHNRALEELLGIPVPDAWN